MAYNYRKTISVDVPNTTSAYVTNDVIGGLITFSVGYPYGEIEYIIATDDDGQDLADKIVFYNAAPQTIADNAAYAVSDTDRTKLIGTATLATYDADADASFNAVSIPFAMNGGDIYAYLVSAAGGTYTAADSLHIKLVVRTN